jgi:hypothetical protein
VIAMESWDDWTAQRLCRYCAYRSALAVTQDDSGVTTYLSGVGYISYPVLFSIYPRIGRYDGVLCSLRSAHWSTPSLYNIVSEMRRLNTYRHMNGPMETRCGVSSVPTLVW